MRFTVIFDFLRTRVIVLTWGWDGINGDEGLHDDYLMSRLLIGNTFVQRINTATTDEKNAKRWRVRAAAACKFKVKLTTREFVDKDCHQSLMGDQRRNKMGKWTIREAGRYGEYRQSCCALSPHSRRMVQSNAKRNPSLREMTRRQLQKPWIGEKERGLDRLTQVNNVRTCKSRDEVVAKLVDFWSNLSRGVLRHGSLLEYHQTGWRIGEGLWGSTLRIFLDESDHTSNTKIFWISTGLSLTVMQPLRTYPSW